MSGVSSSFSEVREATEGGAMTGVDMIPAAIISVRKFAAIFWTEDRRNELAESHELQNHHQPRPNKLTGRPEKSPVCLQHRADRPQIPPITSTFHIHAVLDESQTVAKKRKRDSGFGDDASKTPSIGVGGSRTDISVDYRRRSRG